MRIRDILSLKGGALYINDVPVKRQVVSSGVDETPFGPGRTVTKVRETFPNGVSFITLNNQAGSNAIKGATVN